MLVFGSCLLLQVRTPRSTCFCAFTLCGPLPAPIRQQLFTCCYLNKCRPPSRRFCLCTGCGCHLWSRSVSMVFVPFLFLLPRRDVRGYLSSPCKSSRVTSASQGRDPASISAWGLSTFQALVEQVVCGSPWEKSTVTSLQPRLKTPWPQSPPNHPPTSPNGSPSF
jgi:hypothetical protein